MSKRKKGFTFFESYWTSAEKLEDPTDRAQFITAVCQYGITGEAPELTGAPAAMFELARPNLDTSRKRAEAGRKRINAQQTPNKSTTKAQQKPNDKEKEREKGRQDKGKKSGSAGNKFNNFENGSYTNVEDLEKKLLQ